MAFIVAVKTSFPKNLVNQDQIENLLTKVWPEKEKHINQFSKSTTVKSRHLT
jgi:predicted naringenin-chalcone synthase